MDDEEVALVDDVFDGAFGALGDESWCFGEGVLVSSLVRSTNNCLSGMMVIFGLLEGLEVEALMDAMETHDSINDIVNAIVKMGVDFHDVSKETCQEHTKSTVRLNALKLKKSTNFIRSRKLNMIWSFGFLKDKKRCKIPFICEDTLTIVWNLKNSSEFCKRESDEFILDHEQD
nr:hypothetical protein [Tanacetum cinerariifolium]